MSPRVGAASVDPRAFFEWAPPPASSASISPDAYAVSMSPPEFSASTSLREYSAALISKVRCVRQWGGELSLQFVGWNFVRGNDDSGDLLVKNLFHFLAELFANAFEQLLLFFTVKLYLLPQNRNPGHRLFMAQ